MGPNRPKLTLVRTLDDFDAGVCRRRGESCRYCGGEIETGDPVYLSTGDSDRSPEEVLSPSRYCSVACRHRAERAEVRRRLDERAYEDEAERVMLEQRRNDLEFEIPVGPKQQTL